MSKEAPMTNDQLGFEYWSLLGHWNLGIGHFRRPEVIPIPHQGLGCGTCGWNQVPLPSDQISFFQMATSALMASIMKRAAENASWRCGLATAMRTEGSARGT